jgi:nucleotide-binding universal stress UspA family protein
MTRRRIAVLLEISEISHEILPVVRHLFTPENAELTLIAVAQRNLSPMVTEAYLTGMPPSLYASPIYTEEEWEVHVGGIQETIQSIAQALRSHGFAVQTVLLKGEKVQAIVDYVENRSFDLLAMATYGRKGLSRLVYGSVAERLLRMVTTPMLLYRHQPGKVLAPVAEPQQIVASPKAAFSVLAATNGGVHLQDTLLLASKVARALEGTYTILVTTDDRAGIDIDIVMRGVANTVRTVEPQPVLIPVGGPPLTAISQQLAKDPPDLLVIGASYERQSDNSIAISQTTQQILESTTKSVLVVKGKGSVARMLVCVTDYATPLLDDALQFAQALDARLDVAYVAPPKADTEVHWVDITSPEFGAILEADRPLAGAWQRIQSRLSDRGIAAEALHLGYGEPVPAILELAEQFQYDVIVTGAPGGNQPYAGSFVDQLVQRSSQSVLVIRA